MSVYHEDDSDDTSNNLSLFLFASPFSNSRLKSLLSGLELAASHSLN